MKIYAFDPMLGRVPLNRITIDVANEPLKPGPAGSRVRVIDYDGANDCFYEPVDLDDRSILMQGGLDPSESDPQFHQQMVYAVTIKVLENFERALGRKVSFRGRRPLRMFPHAFQGRNAFFDPKLHALLFGYFPADREDPGPNLPGQTVFTCLSHDIVAHEMTHALVHRLRPHFFNRTNRDVLAFHEGFSDIVAIFQHFSFPEILHDHIQRTRGDLRQSDALIDLAAQFGYATGSGMALRKAVSSPDPQLYETLTEAHDRGSLLVAAVFDAFFVTYQRRIADLVRIATGGTGKLPDGDLHPDLVNRIATEVSRTAQSILTMCIRAFEYLPPVDITFGDYLRALVTADFELSPADEHGQRRAMIEAFRARGIYPDGVYSLAEESLLYPPAEPLLPNFSSELLGNLALEEYVYSRIQPAEETEAPDSGVEEEEGSPGINRVLAGHLNKFARANAAKLGFDPKGKGPAVQGFHPSFRVNSYGQLLMELVAQFVQEVKTDEDFGGMKVFAGATVVASADGTIRYVIAKPFDETLGSQFAQEARNRKRRQRSLVEACDREDPFLPWAGLEYEKMRIATVNLAQLHGRLRR
ncbi:MAG TPA: hypothetical protein VF173_16805 [Thermoanaerobaculia bacterium]|nr:hypothetical protein [Thermoanaerobaculia bacterium]